MQKINSKRMSWKKRKLKKKSDFKKKICSNKPKNSLSTEKGKLISMEKFKEIWLLAEIYRVISLN